MPENIQVKINLTWSQLEFLIMQTAQRRTKLKIQLIDMDNLAERLDIIKKSNKELDY